jgi:hypothetical protein
MNLTLVSTLRQYLYAFFSPASLQDGTLADGKKILHAAA